MEFAPAHATDVVAVPVHVAADAASLKQSGGSVGHALPPLAAALVVVQVRVAAHVVELVESQRVQEPMQWSTGEAFASQQSASVHTATPSTQLHTFAAWFSAADLKTQSTIVVL